MTTLLPHELYLLRYIAEVIIPMYERALRKQLEPMSINHRQSNAIAGYCRFHKLPIHFFLPDEGEIDIGDAHVIFEHMKKHISF